MSMSTMTSSGEAMIPNGWTGQIDSKPSLESKRPLENRAITEALQKIDRDIEQLLQLRASLAGYGFSKICPTEITTVTEDEGLVLGAKEKNPAVKGTLAHLLNETITGFSEYMEKEESNFRCLGTVTEDQANNVIGYLGINGSWKVTGYQLNTGFAGYNRSFEIIGIDCTDELENRTSTGVQIALTSHAEILKRKCRNGIWESWTEL